MFTKIKLKNFKSLLDFEVEFNKNRKLILIYGENGVGKSNFIEAFNILRKLVTGKPIGMYEFLESVEIELRGDSINIEGTDNDDIVNYFKVSNIRRIIESCKTLNSEGENMCLSFDFKLGTKKGTYSVETDDYEIVSEKLEYVYNRELVEFFNITDKGIFINKNVIKNQDYYNELLSSCEKYWGKNTLMSMLFKDKILKNDKYMSKCLTKNMIELVDYFSNLNVGVSGQTLFPGISLGRGVVPVSKEKEIDKNEEILNDIFVSLYTDIKQAYYQRERIDNNKIKYKLYFKKLIGGKILDVSIGRESKGTKQVLNLMQQILYSLDKQVLIIDEFDTGIHDILAKSILQSLYDSLEGQLIITTHNTLLIESKDLCKNAYVFTHHVDGRKEMLSISDFEKRVHTNLNIRDRYLKGMYGGVPIPIDIDFSDYKDMVSGG